MIEPTWIGTIYACFQTNFIKQKIIVIAQKKGSKCKCRQNVEAAKEREEDCKENSLEWYYKWLVITDILSPKVGNFFRLGHKSFFF